MAEADTSYLWILGVGSEVDPFEGSPQTAIMTTCICFHHGESKALA
jgi:hypothetical protein